ncbi:MAG TPA: glutamate synthase subunit beta [Anaerolineae bacterium]|nr:glutamate synthase subunit beta [Anaerolineae bacterium]
MGKDTGFKEFERKVPAYQSVEERIRHWQEFALPMATAEVEEQGARCMNCGVPFCHQGCPLANVIPDFNDHAYHGKWERALTSLYSTNNFPEFTGRVCPAPCESACVLAINKPAVTIKNIELTIIEKAFEEGWATPRPPHRRSGNSVAVVGSGPAGLAAADQLNRAGHNVTVFERADRIGGLLRYGIPDFKLGKSVVDRRLEVMRAEGVAFRTGVHVGVDYPANQLLSKFDAVVLAGGSTTPRDLPIPGRELPGVELAMDFLTQSNRRVAGDSIPSGTDILATGKDVVVIGGGDTGSDCVGTSIRQGARSVTQIEIMPRPPEGRTTATPWPTHPGPRMYSTSSSQAEGALRDWAVMSREFLADESGALRAISAVRSEWGSGGPREIPDSQLELPAQLVLLAMGFLHPEHVVLDDLGLEKDERGNCAANDYATSHEGVFVAGDMRRGQSLVVWAISEGRECARAVDEYLTGRPSLLAAKDKSRSDVALAL